MTANQLIVSPCSNPELDLAEALKAYHDLGFSRFEVFTGSPASPNDFNSAFDVDQDPKYYVTKGLQYGMDFVSVHLPKVDDEVEASLQQAIASAHFARSLGAEIVIFKATTRQGYVRAAKPFLDAIEGLGLTPVLQNHAGHPISSIDDYREVIEGISDSRMKTLLEVGQFHSVGVSWQDGFELLGDSIALVHLKDQVGRQSVPFGTGEIDICGLIGHMTNAGYGGDYVVEMEVVDTVNTLRYLSDARRFLENCFAGISE